jgi:glycosyltransferase involved in cell wall biosynthesis
VAVVIPSFRAATSIAAVIGRIGTAVQHVYVVDDGCPDATGAVVRRHIADSRVVVIENERNLGVGGAVKRGYRRALAEGVDIIVKLDADGQMDPAHIPLLIEPLAAGRADYAKGNRFADPKLMPAGTAPGALEGMPRRRRFANGLLSMVHKIATGCWHVDDPANGYTAIHARALRHLDLCRLADCFFFETDMLFGLNRIGAVVADVPLPARYSGEVSNVRLRRVALRFCAFIVRRSLQRLAAKWLPIRV